MRFWAEEIHFYQENEERLSLLDQLDRRYGTERFRIIIQKALLEPGPEGVLQETVTKEGLRETSSQENSVSDRSPAAPAQEPEAFPRVDNGDGSILPASQLPSPDTAENRTVPDSLQASAQAQAPFVRNLADPKQLTQNTVEAILSIALTKKVVLLFDRELGGLQASNVLAIFDKLEELKKDEKFSRLLKNVVVEKFSTSGKLPENLQEYLGKQGVEVFMFARATERDKLAAIEPRAHSVYVNEQDFPLDSYYPLLEIVTIALSQFIDPDTLKEISRIAEKLNIQSIKDDSGILVFTLLPNAERHNTQDLIKRYALLKQLLISA